jgi:hypothetical protein
VHILYDANVLYPALLRSFLMYLGEFGLFRARWTDEIHNEWINALLRERPELSPIALARTRTLMDLHTEGALVTGYESLIPSINLPDLNDRHVLAAAIHARVNIIITYNLSDFPATVLAPYKIEAEHPDDFLSDLFDINPHAIIKAVHQQRSKLKNPPILANELIDSMERLKLTMTARNLREYVDLI